jgi:hypothetical protein
MTDLRPAAGGYLRFLGLMIGVTVLVALVGIFPTRRLAGEAGLPALVAGCVVTVLASALGAIPIAVARRFGAASTAQGIALGPILSSMVLRLGATVFLTWAVALVGRFLLAPLLLWVAVSYAAQLAIDTRYALRG